MSITTIPIVQLDFPNDQYVKEEKSKNQIVLHHTVSGSNAKGVANYWKSDQPRISTCLPRLAFPASRQAPA